MEKYGISFQDMSFKGKVMHIWEYYRWHILVTIISVIVGGSLIKTVLTPRVINDVDIMLAGKMSYDETEQQVVDQFQNDFKTGLSFSVMDWTSMGELEMVMYQKIPLLISTKELDILGVSTEQFNAWAAQMGPDMFLPLDTYPECQELLEKYSDQLVTCDKLQDEEGNYQDVEEHVYGIKVTNYKNMSCLKGNEEMVIGITSTVKDLEKAISMVEYIVEEDAK